MLFLSHSLSLSLSLISFHLPMRDIYTRVGIILQFRRNGYDFSACLDDCECRKKSGVPAIVQHGPRRERGTRPIGIQHDSRAPLLEGKKRRGRSGERAININRAADRVYESTQLIPPSSTIRLRLPTNQDQAFRQPIHGKIRSFFEIF